MNISVDVAANMDAATAYQRGIPEALLTAADRGFEVSQRRVPVDRGTLLQSGVPPTERSDGSVVWGYNAPYARPVEHGAGPHWAPIEPLKGWARRVLGDEDAAYAVQHTIAQEGTPAQPFVAPGVQAMRAQLRATGLKSFVMEHLR